MDARTAFKNNLPEFVVSSLRGNVVADAENFTSKGGRNFVSFKVAHNFGRDGDTAFIKVMHENGDTIPSKGDYVEVSGDYTESTNGEYLNRTLFAKSVEILGTASENGSPGKSKAAPSKSKTATRKR